MTEDTISFLPSLDALEHKGAWLFPKMDSKMNEHGFTCQPYEGKILTHQKLKQSGKSGICSEERSLISPEYARNFICDFILGKKQEIGQLSLF